MFVIQYSRATPRSGYRNYGPTVWEVAKITGDAVWGIQINSRILRKVNGPVNDGSGRSWALEAYPTAEEATAAAAAWKAEAA